ncbi:hypothetical protein [Streptomyces sp. NPDC058620]|uniref:hypothetical protein n=1 Tax=Streptomyces sp. NPDC058620 TaxID=3346560 RepID=UPI003652A19C
MSKKSFMARCAATAAITVAAVLVPATQASAYITYSEDQCSSSTRCFAIIYNSTQSSGTFHSACFLTNKTEDSHTGYNYLTSSGMQEIRYQFGYDMGISLPNGSSCRWTEGSGQGVKNNAAGGSNGDSRSHRIYYNSNQSGAYQTIEADHNENLISSLKNENASSARL